MSVCVTATADDVEVRFSIGKDVNIVGTGPDLNTAVRQLLVKVIGLRDEAAEQLRRCGINVSFSDDTEDMPS